MNAWARRTPSMLLRITKDAMRGYEGNRHVSITVKNHDIILDSEGYDATLSREGGGVHFSVVKLNRIIPIPANCKFKVDTTKNRIVIHLDEIIEDKLDYEW